MDDPNGERTHLGFDWTVVRAAPPLRPLDPRRTALMCVDLQYMCIHPDFGNARAARENGVDITPFVRRIDDSFDPRFGKKLRADLKP